MSVFQQAKFLLSAADIKQLPADQGYEVALVGRSNAGKSSVLNKITHKNLARVSKTPGRTQLINLFTLDEKRRLVDLPGYGFAKVSLAQKQRWQQLVDQYLSRRNCLRGLILVMDIRHPLKELDIQLLQFCQAQSLPVHILLNKCDKLSFSQAKQTLSQVRSFLTEFGNSASVQIFSVQNNTGNQALREILATWYGFI